MGHPFPKPSLVSMSIAPSSTFSGVHALERNTPPPGASLRDALAEIQTAQLTLQAFASLTIEHLDEMAGEFRTRQRREPKGSPRVEDTMLRDPIEQLSAVAAELTALVAEQRELASNTSNVDRQGAGTSSSSSQQESSP